VVVPVEGFIVLAILVGAITAFGLAALRYGADSRDTRWAILG
jgi:hypothetical protein